MSRNVAKTVDDQLNMKELIEAEEELYRLRQEHGIQKEEGRISRVITKTLNAKEAREKHYVDRKKYLLIALFTGWLGGHHFYAKRYGLGVLYLLLFWTGIPIAMTIIDLMAALPLEVSEDGQILL